MSTSRGPTRPPRATRLRTRPRCLAASSLAQARATFRAPTRCRSRRSHHPPGPHRCGASRRRTRACPRPCTGQTRARREHPVVFVFVYLLSLLHPRVAVDVALLARAWQYAVWPRMECCVLVWCGVCVCVYAYSCSCSCIVVLICNLAMVFSPHRPLLPTPRPAPS